MNPRPGRMVHCSFPKAALIEEIQRSGARGVLVNWAGSDAEALSALEADPRSYFVFGQCDNKGPDGDCLGHDLVGPIRVQRKRSRGWKMPENTVYVGRPGVWGNPFRVGGYYKRGERAGNGLRWVFVEAAEGHQDPTYTKIASKAQAVEWFRWYQSTKSDVEIEQMRAALRGKNLACWCPLNQPCHGDVLLEIANQ